MIFFFFNNNLKFVFFFILFRCNSKASYLPRQSREKLNIDPDHGIYKLTLTSNEDCINHNNNGYHHQNDLLASKCNNLPDVLPVGVKVHTSQSPRYGSNNNLSTAQQQYHHHKLMASPQTAPPQQQHYHHHNYNSPQSATSYSMKSVFNFNRHTMSSPVSPTSTMLPPHQSFNRISNSTESIVTAASVFHPPTPPAKYVSQSNIDLKKTHILTTSDTNTKLFPGSDETEQYFVNDGNDNQPQTPPTTIATLPTTTTTTTTRQSPYTIRHEFVSRKLSLEDQTNNSMAVNRSTTKKESEKVIRKDSLKENIDKITQLQSKLMSAHLHEQQQDKVQLGRESSFRNNLKDESTTRISTEPIESFTTSAQPVAILNAIAPTPVIVAEIKETTIIPSSTNTIDIDSLKLLQRTEIVLRLNAPTSEVASQTDDTLGCPSLQSALCAKSEDDQQQLTCDTSIRLGSSLTELDCEQLSQELMRQLSPTDRLHHILGIG